MNGAQDRKLNVEFLPKGVIDPQFQQRESGVAHTPYSREVAFYTCIKNGDLHSLKSNMASFMQESLVVGRMSNDNLRQVKYLAVSCVTLATRYVVEGGLLESEAYNLSDKYIQCVDRMNEPQEIMNFLVDKAIELTQMVYENKQRLEYPSYLRKAIRFIDYHLHNKLSCSAIAKGCGVSSDYMSAKFKEYVGIGMKRYILLQKLEASKELLLGDFPYKEVGYYFGFCSQTHYIECFVKEFGMTPKEYVKLNKR